MCQHIGFKRSGQPYRAACDHSAEGWGKQKDEKDTGYDVSREVVRDGTVLGIESLIWVYNLCCCRNVVYYRSALSNFMQNSCVNARAAEI